MRRVAAGSGNAPVTRRAATAALLAASLLFAAAAHAPTRPARSTTTTTPAASATVSGAVLQWDRWTSLPGPPALVGASSAYDADDDELIVFGGRSTAGTVTDDTWIWNEKDWVRIPASQTIAPPAREDASMAFDPFLHQLILFGGEDGAGHLLGDTWAWNGYSWYQLTGAAPGPREEGALSFDPEGDLVVFGGFGYPFPFGYEPGHVDRGSPPVTAPADAALTTGQLLGDTWVWTSAGWFAKAVPGPSPRAASAIGYDPGRRQTVLFGGSTDPTGMSARTLTDTWVWSGSAWSETSARPPASRASPTLVDDISLGTLLMVGGARSRGSSTALWRWSSGAWSALDASSSPPARSGGLAAYDSTSSTVLFGGGLVGGGDPGGGVPASDYWQLLATAQPAARAGGGQGATTPATTRVDQPATTLSPSASVPGASRGRAHRLTTGRVTAAASANLPSWPVTTAMLGIALAIPACAWLVIDLSGRMRRRRAGPA